MKILKLSGQFKKDLKRYKHQKAQLDALEIILGYLQRGEEIPKEYKPHMLVGDYVGHMECHVHILNYFKNMHKMDKESAAYKSKKYDDLFRESEINNMVKEDVVVGCVLRTLL